jgi:hypothetical protein
LSSYVTLGNGRIEIKFGISFVQVSFDHDEDEDEDDRWDYDVHGARDLDWSCLTANDKACLEEQAMSLIGSGFDDLNPVFRDYTGSSVTLECDETDDVDDRASGIEYLSFDKGLPFGPPDFKDDVEPRAWVMR